MLVICHVICNFMAGISRKMNNKNIMQYIYDKYINALASYWVLAARC